MIAGVWPSTVAAQVVCAVPARQQINIGAGGTQSLTRGQIVAALNAFSLSLYGPAGTLITNFTLNSMPVGWVRRDGGASPFSTWTVQIPTTVYAGAGGGAGVYTVTIVYSSGAEYQSNTVAFLWGGWVDTMLTNISTAATQATTAATAAGNAETAADGAETQATAAAASAATAATEAETARKLLTNRIEVNSATNPTALTIYDDDGTTPLFTRTIGNGDGSAVSPVQVLRLGACV